MAAVGMDHTVFLTEEGQVWTCGMNQYHQVIQFSLTLVHLELKN